MSRSVCNSNKASAVMRSTGYRTQMGGKQVGIAGIGGGPWHIKAMKPNADTNYCMSPSRIVMGRNSGKTEKEINVMER